MHGAYETAAGTLGANRESMKHNTLLLRPPLGKPTCWGDDVDPSVANGLSSLANDDGVPKAMSWDANVWLPYRNGRGSAGPRDYIALNKAAIRAGLCTARQAQEFRAAHDIHRVVDGPEDRSGWHLQALQNPPETKVAGTKTKPPAVILDVMATQHEDLWIDRLQRKQQADASFEGTAGNTASAKFFETRSSVLKQHHNEAANHAFWRLPEFHSNALPRVSTRRPTSKFGHASYTEAASWQAKEK